MRSLTNLLLFIALFGANLGVLAQEGAISRQEYLDYVTAAAENGWSDLEDSRVRWKENLDLEYVFGYSPPGNDVYLAAVCANLYEITRDAKYLDRIKELLLYYGEYKKAYPKEFLKTKVEYSEGLPALPNIFTFGKYLQAFEILRKYTNLSSKERQTIERNISESADFFVNLQEWGPMNRAMLRAEALLYAAKILPHHPTQPNWNRLGQAIMNDNWGQWEIEDASGYNGVWLYSLLRYVSYVREDEGMFKSPIMNYYFQYFLALMSPAGIVPDFGDSYWGTSWNRMIPFFEKGAASFKDPHLRWAAAQYFRKYVDPQTDNPSLFVALTLSDAYRWTDFDLDAKPPSVHSQEALEDLIGKKVVFRNGWDRNSTYMLYNYRDEGDGGWLFREYLRTTIPVEEEKMHHGHSDENSIVLLMKNNTILLHDGGYRDFMPSGPYGQFRADYFHNRVVVRDGKITVGQEQGQHRYAVKEAVPGQTMLDYFQNSGAHRPVSTKKIDFLTLENYDMSRSRITDTNLGYEADRIINYVKELDWFVVFDVVKFGRDTYLTMANLWHTRQVLAQGPGWYDTTYDSLRNLDVAGPERLLIYFPYQERLYQGMEEHQRYWQDEKVMYQLIGRHGYPNDLQVFVTVLIPHSANENPDQLVRGIRLLDVEEFPVAVGIEIEKNDKKYLIGTKLDLQAELIRDWRRPMYNYDSGKVRYGDYETDAFNLFVVEDRQNIHYAIAGAVKIMYKDRVLHEQLPAEFGLNFDGSPDLPGIGKLRYWEEEVSKQ